MQRAITGLRKKSVVEEVEKVLRKPRTGFSGTEWCQSQPAGATQTG